MFLPWAIFSKSLSKKIWIWLLLGILIAMLAEGIQYFIPYRAFNVNDALANTIGVILGFIIFAAFKWALQNFNNKRKRK
jgi:VanZ family protein